MYPRSMTLEHLYISKCSLESIEYDCTGCKMQKYYMKLPEHKILNWSIMKHRGGRYTKTATVSFQYAVLPTIKLEKRYWVYSAKDARSKI